MLRFICLNVILPNKLHFPCRKNRITYAFHPLQVGPLAVRGLYLHVSILNVYSFKMIGPTWNIYIYRCTLFVNPLKTEFLQNFIYKSSPYLTGNILRLHYRAQPVNAV
jgi:hypothetical protein